MHPNFSLENPETFNAVFPWTQIESRKKEPGQKSSSSKLLQEKVTYLCWSIQNICLPCPNHLSLSSIINLNVPSVVAFCIAVESLLGSG